MYQTSLQHAQNFSQIIGVNLQICCYAVSSIATIFLAIAYDFLFKISKAARAV